MEKLRRRVEDQRRGVEEQRSERAEEWGGRGSRGETPPQSHETPRPGGELWPALLPTLYLVELPVWLRSGLRYRGHVRVR